MKLLLLTAVLVAATQPPVLAESYPNYRIEAESKFSVDVGLGDAIAFSIRVEGQTDDVPIALNVSAADTVSSDEPQHPGGSHVVVADRVLKDEVVGVDELWLSADCVESCSDTFVFLVQPIDGRAATTVSVLAMAERWRDEFPEDSEIAVTVDEVRTVPGGTIIATDRFERPVMVDYWVTADATPGHVALYLPSPDRYAHSVSFIERVLDQNSFEECSDPCQDGGIVAQPDSRLIYYSSESVDEGSVTYRVAPLPEPSFRFEVQATGIRGPATVPVSIEEDELRPQIALWYEYDGGSRGVPCGLCSEFHVWVPGGDQSTEVAVWAKALRIDEVDLVFAAGEPLLPAQIGEPAGADSTSQPSPVPWGASVLALLLVLLAGAGVWWRRTSR